MLYLYKLNSHPIKAAVPLHNIDVLLLSYPVLYWAPADKRPRWSKWPSNYCSVICQKSDLEWITVSQCTPLSNLPHWMKTHILYLRQSKPCPHGANGGGTDGKPETQGHTKLMNTSTGTDRMIVSMWDPKELTKNRQVISKQNQLPSRSSQ